MALTYGFYNSVNKDRTYNAIQFSQIFDGVIKDGIYMSILNHFQVRSNNTMSVIVGGGRAWFNNTWTYNDSDFSIAIDPSEIAANRIDAIVLVVNTKDTVRANSIEYVKGTPSSSPVKPTFEDEGGVFYHPLAYITVVAATNAILASNIENVIGIDERTPYVTGILEHVTAGDMLNQWASEWDEYKVAKREEYEKWVSDQEIDMETWEDAQRQAFDDWMLLQESNYIDWSSNEQSNYESWEDSQKNAFYDWFNGLRETLDTDPAGHLQNEIDEINEREFKRYYDICTKRTIFNKDENDSILSIVSTGEGVTATTTFDRKDESTIITTVVTDGVDTYTETVTISENTVIENYTKS